MKSFVRHLPVHCHDDPAKRLGWAPAPHVTAPGPIWFAIGRTCTDLLTGEVTRAARFDTEVGWLVGGEDRQLAVMSAGQSIEVWRKVPGFLEERRR